MHAVAYQSDELKLLYRVLQDALREQTVHAHTPPYQDMISRLFVAADQGERDPAKLKTAILRCAARKTDMLEGQ